MAAPAAATMTSQQPSITTTSGFALTAAEQISTALWRGTIDSRFTQPQFLALSGLFHKPGIGHYELADRVGIDRATIGPILARLTAQCLVDRRKDQRDSRRSVLTLSPRAMAILAEMVAQVAQVDQRLMAPLSQAEKAALVQSWALLGDHLPRDSDDEPAPDALAVPLLSHYPWYFLRQACRRYRRLWRERVDENISPSLFALMDVVSAQPHIDIRGAAIKASIEESNAVRMVMRLVRTRIMRDPRDPQDARRSLLSLTDAGQGIFADLNARATQVQKALTQRLPPMAVDEFHRLTRLVARLA